jgi:hypothetical protein
MPETIRHFRKIRVISVIRGRLLLLNSWLVVAKQCGLSPDEFRNLL